jgi:hypothetical protein
MEGFAQFLADRASVNIGRPARAEWNNDLDRTCGIVIGVRRECPGCQNACEHEQSCDLPRKSHALFSNSVTYAAAGRDYRGRFASVSIAWPNPLFAARSLVDAAECRLATLCMLR